MTVQILLTADTAEVCRAVMDDLPLTPVKALLGRRLEPSTAATCTLGWYTLLTPSAAAVTVQPMGAYRPVLRGPEPLGDPVVVWWGPGLGARLLTEALNSAGIVAGAREQARRP